MKNRFLEGMLILVIGTGVFASETLYKSCKGCHGINAEKKALGKSKIISEMSEKELTSALMGYKDGSYGGAMKGLMKGQVAGLNKKDIVELSKYIVSLNK